MNVGLKVIVFEQKAEVLEQRLGFRVAEYGLRQVFPRVPDHPLLAGIRVESLHDWRGEATILPARLQYTLKPMYGPMVKWCGMDVPRAWRAGCQGNVASVLIEKPSRGDFLPIIDGGFSLQYSPLMQYREGRGVILFCQLDVTGRTESDPGAIQIARNILKYVSEWKPSPHHQAVYVGDAQGRSHLESCGFTFESLTSQRPSPGRVVIVGPGYDNNMSRTDFVLPGDQVFALGLNRAEIHSLTKNRIQTESTEHIAATFPSGIAGSWREGIGAADIHNRDPRAITLVTGGAEVVGDGVLAKSNNITFCQLAPWLFDTAKVNQKRTFRHTSFLLTRLLSNMGVASTTPLLNDFSRQLGTPEERRWLHGLYLDRPEEWDDPYRFFPW